MANKVLPLLVAGGAALLFLPKKKKPESTSGKKSNGEVGGDSNGDISKTGTLFGWNYRVRKAKTVEGFSVQYFGEVQAPDSKTWVKAHQDARTDPEAARFLAMEAIATRVAAADTPEDNLVFNSGSMSDWNWRVMRTVPMEGFGVAYFGEMQAPDSQQWTRVHNDARVDPEAARLLALEAIAMKLEELANAGN